MEWNDLKNSELAGKIWFMPTDTIPGLSCLATDESSVNRITALKNRRGNKVGYIVLIASVEQLHLFGMHPSEQEVRIMNKLWPGKYTIVSKTKATKYQYLTTAGEPIGFRIPDNKPLLDVLREVGPMVSTSCNRSGEPAIVNKEEAMETFGAEIDYYLDVAEISDEPSTIIKIIR